MLPALAFAPFCNARADESGRTLIRVNIPGPRSLPFLPIELIPLLGIDKRLNAQLIIRYFPSGVRALEDMLAGNAQFSAQGFTVLHAFHAKGAQVKAIAPLSGSVPPFGIVVRSDLRGRVKSVADLKGKSIGVSIGSVTSKTYLQQLVELFLAVSNVSPEELRWVPTAQNWDGQLGALSSKSVDAVFCEEPFLTGLVRNRAGFVLSDFSDPWVMSKIPGAGHLRATLTTTAEMLKQEPHTCELVVRMLQQSLEWIFNSSADVIAGQLDIGNQEEMRDLIKVLRRNRNIYASDPRFSQQQIAATLQFMRATGLPVDESFDLNILIDKKIAGEKP